MVDYTSIAVEVACHYTPPGRNQRVLWNSCVGRAYAVLTSLIKERIRRTRRGISLVSGSVTWLATGGINNVVKDTRSVEEVARSEKHDRG